MRLTLLIGIILIISPINAGAFVHPTFSANHTLTDSAMGVVVLDDLHANDYTPSAVSRVKDSLEKMGYLFFYASNFSSWRIAVSKAHYLVISAPFASFSSDDLQVINEWFANGSRNLILASRGDYSQPDYDSMNNILAQTKSSIRVQDDNIYTTDSNARQPWYIDTSNFNTAYSTLFQNVDNINFFSPSSITYNSSATVLVHAEAKAYQSDEQGAPPNTIYDNTDDGTGGDSIPLAGYEETHVGDLTDRVVVLGTTLWSDYDYGDSSADDPIFFENTLKFLTEQTIEESGPITIDLPDDTIPNVRIAFPHKGAILKGTVDIIADAYDAFGIASYEIFINGVSRSTSSVYTWDTTKEANGVYTVKVVAKDPSGNEGSVTQTYVINQDYTPSTPSIPKIMTYNIKESGIFSEWIDVVKEENPDVLILVETGNFDDNSNSLLNKYTTELNEYFFDKLPYNSYTLQNIEKSYNGITILSRYDILETQKIDTLTLDNGNKYNVPLPFLYAKLDIEKVELHVIGGHLTCCTDGLLNRMQEQEGIINFMDNLGDVPIIYLGDMNSESPDDTNDTVSDLGVGPIEMLLNNSDPKASTIHQFTDVYRTLNPNDPGYSYGGFSRIDYIFTNQWFENKLINSTVGDTPSAKLGSDHVPVDAFIDFSEWITNTVKTNTSSISSSTTSSDKLPIVQFSIILPAFIAITILLKRKYKLKL